ncbi:hypothetical protein OG21DRAFT_1523276 [Imleria badia]|nr:hypothetical protein OG21DRAFT_1523276 [Imleria badia]
MCISSSLAPLALYISLLLLLLQLSRTTEITSDDYARKIEEDCPTTLVIKIDTKLTPQDTPKRAHSGVPPSGSFHRFITLFFYWTMLMNQILDSSNSLRDPDEHSRPIKRSASVASLPTPPRTRHKRSRSRARSSVSHHDSDDNCSASELDDDRASGYAKRIKRVKTTRNSKTVSDNDELSEDESPERKKRRTLGVLPGHEEDEEDENAFWTGRTSQSRGEKQEKKVAEADKTEESSPSPAMLRYRIKAPVSPPPSRRQPLIQPARAASVEREDSSTDSGAPVTPPRRLFLRAPSPSAADTFKTPTKSKATKIWPKRDSPNNPFLVDSDEKVKLRSEWDSSDDESEVVGEALVREGTPTPTYEEKPTITYVFRGQKATFHNPLFGLAPEVVAASRLPIDHPDYEAAEACPPKRLFSAGKRKSRDHSREKPSSEGVKRAKVQRSENDHDETSEGEQSGTGIESHKKLSLADSAETETAPSKPACEASSRPVDTEELQSAREERERRETAAKSRLASRDGLRAGAIFAERDEPARRAIGPLRSA